ncbi:oligosaccharide flippase family protein [archaeon]|nr:oligosaccharide flippase family protein [archaeon]
MINYLKEEAFGITKRLLKRDFSGETGLAVKNSIFQFSTNVVSKIGSLLFTVILARLLLPEKFGLYSLALSTIILIGGFSDLGIGTTLVRYVSRENKKAGGYIKYLAKLKITLTLLVSLVLIGSAYWLANNFYSKPIFYALLAGSIYILSVSFTGFIASIFQAENNFKWPLFKEIFFQILRLVILPLTILFTIGYSTELFLMYIFIALSVCYLISLFFLIPRLKKYTGDSLKSKQKEEVNKYILPLSATVLSGVFFGYIDTIMLGRFVASEFLAYYQAAFALASSAIVLVSFSAVLFPIFSRISGKRLRVGLKKSIFVTIPLSILAMVGTILIAPFIVNLVYGTEYSPAILLLRVLALIFITDPLIGIFSSYHYSQGNTKKVAKAVIFSTGVNIILNYTFITYLLATTGSMYNAVLGAAAATLISRSVYLGLLIIGKKKL